MQAVKYVEYETNFSEEEKKQTKVLKVTCNLNNAACKLKLNDYKQAEKLCTKVCLGLSSHFVFIFCITNGDIVWMKVLELQSTNVKALYRRAQAHINMDNLDLAEFDLKKAFEIDPENR